MNAFLDTITLTHYLTAILVKENGPVEIISRFDFYERSTFPIEIVECKTGDGKTINLFCKYLAGMGPNNHGHRGGVEYEAKFYADVLDKSTCSKIKYFGQCSIQGSNDTLLVIEYIGETLRLLYSEDPDALIKASEWISNFHLLQEGNAPAFVKVYDKDYYLNWLERLKNLTELIRKNNPWLEKLLKYYEDNLEVLLDGPQTIIHGEYYPNNILLKEGIIYPVDWESAAIGPGEIDLASLIEGWDNEAAEKIKEVYKKTRWPLGIFSEEEFEKRLLMAQIYFYFWWWPEDSDNINLNDSDAFQKLFLLAKKASIV